MSKDQVKVNSNSNGHVSGQPVTENPSGSKGKAKDKQAGIAK